MFPGMITGLSTAAVLTTGALAAPALILLGIPHRISDPEIYLHYPSGQKLAGNETRNLNRSYPGKIDGSVTERVAYAIMNMIKSNKIDMALD
jgi:hypothetical protein